MALQAALRARPLAARLCRAGFGAPNAALPRALPWPSTNWLRAPASTSSGHDSKGPAAPTSGLSEPPPQQESVSAILAGVFRGMTSGAEAPSSPEERKADATPVDRAAITRFLGLAHEERWQIAAATATVLVSSGVSLIFPAAIGQVLDVALDPSSGQTPTGIALGLAALFGAQSGLVMLRSALLSVSGERIAARLRARVFARLLEQDIAWHDGQRVGALTNTLSNDISKMQACLTSQITGALRSLLMTVASAGMLFLISPSLAAASCILVPPTVVAAVFFGRYMKRKQAAVQAGLASTLSVAEEVLAAMRVVRQFAAEGKEVARYSDAVWRAFGHARSVGIAGAVFDGTVHAAANFAIIAVLWYGGNLVLAGELSAGQLTSFLMYALYAAFNSSGLSTAYTEFSKGVGASGKVFAVLDAQPEVPLAGGAKTLPALPAPAGVHVKVPPPGLDLRFHDVTFAYPQRASEAVLKHLSLHVARGEHAALVGASGSGKSTVAALLTRLYEPGAGHITANGVDIATLDASWWRSRVGVVQQEAPLFAGSIGDNIAYAAGSASRAAVEAAARVAQAHDFISALPRGYDTEVGERGVRLSGGQRQRICIARAVLADPPVVVLDEATSAQDAATEAGVHEALGEFLAGRTVLSVAHRLSTIQAADSVRMLGGGHVVEAGGYDDLLARRNGAFRALVDKQLTLQ